MKVGAGVGKIKSFGSATLHNWGPDQISDEDLEHFYMDPDLTIPFDTIPDPSPTVPFEIISDL